MHALHSLCRGSGRFMPLIVIGIALMWLSNLVGPPLPSWAAPVAFGLGLTILGLGASDLVLRVLQPKVDASDAAKRGVNHGNIAAAIVYASRTALGIAVMFLLVGAARADAPPTAALHYLPLLKAEQLAHWPAAPMPPALGAQIEQETCITLRHRSCWNPRAELRTSREQGIGFGQLTRSWSASGALRFDAMGELTRAHVELRGLTWANPYDPVLQLRALVLKDRDIFDLVRWAPDARERMAFALAAYNGGWGGVLSDRQQCKATAGCDPSRWFGNVERTSLKAKTAIAGYGKSFFETNREYPRNILGPRLARYQLLADINPVSIIEKNGQLAS